MADAVHDASDPSTIIAPQHENEPDDDMGDIRATNSPREARKTRIRKTLLPIRAMASSTSSWPVPGIVEHLIVRQRYLFLPVICLSILR